MNTVKNRLTIVADAHIWEAESAFRELEGYEVELRTLESREISRDLLLDTDILLTRSSTRVNASLLAGTPVRFAGTATIGDDHYDKHWLQQQGISFANAAGSSTGSVIEYMMATLLSLHADGLISIPQTTIGIIGVGRIGSLLAGICRALGMSVLLNDPPRARHEGPESFATLDTLLVEADLITLHTPLIQEGEDCTRHLLDAERLRRYHGRGIINAARGSCIDNHALLAWLEHDAKNFAVLDCWENEPTPATELIAHAGMIIATPHIAGHSLDGKAANTQYIYDALCRFLGIQGTWHMQYHLPQECPVAEITHLPDPWQNLHRAASTLYPIQRDHTAMKSWCSLAENELKQAFGSYRRHYPVRRAWQHAPLHFDTPTQQLGNLAAAIGIKLV